jgi:serine/threonine-protein kinase
VNDAAPKALSEADITQPLADPPSAAGTTAALAAPITQLGRYEVIARLGEGAMGTVYKARDPLLDRLVAIKTVNLNLPKEDLAEYEARFYQEARAAGGLSHPNIVVIHDIGKTEQVAFMAMEYLEGRELRTILSQRGALPVEDAVRIGAQVAEGLAYAHGRGVIHRDVKPTNIMIGRDGHAKITDFGIARMRTSELKTMTGMILGSPRYMSPEQVSGKRADHRSDIFALGVVLYEMLTGQPPFQADTVHGVMYQTMSANPPAPSTLRQSIPPILDFVVAKALAKVPEARYQDARELAEDLRASLEAGRAGAVEQRIRASLAAAPMATALPEVETRHDNLDAPSDETTEEIPLKLLASQPSFTVSKVFDSTEATLRLAALAGQSLEPPAPKSRGQLQPPPVDPGAPPAAKVAPWLWAVAGAALVAAAAILLLG